MICCLNDFVDGNGKNDPEAFIFTLNNPHGTKPTRYMKRKESQRAIFCAPNSGPIFGNEFYWDICIDDNCDQSKKCWIDNDGEESAYCCSSLYKKALYVNSNNSNATNEFIVLDYEVYSIDYKSKKTIYSYLKYPDIIWNFMQTNNIDEGLLKKVDSEIELFHILDQLQCNSKEMILKLRRHFLTSPSFFLPDSLIVDAAYDSSLKEWIGDYHMKLIYRASQYNYSPNTFYHACSSIKGPTLVVIKNKDGWIFGGFTTQSWSLPNTKDGNQSMFHHHITNLT